MLVIENSMHKGIIFGLLILTLLSLNQAAKYGDVQQSLGDGYLPIFGPDTLKVFNINHHIIVTIQCSDFAIGKSCEGYPYLPDYSKFISPFTALTSTIISGAQFYCTDPLVDDCYKLYFPIYIQYSNYIRFGISCVDTKQSPPSLCEGEEFIDLGPNKYTYLVDSQRLFSGMYNLIKHGTKYYSYSAESQVLCYDTITKSICSGYPIDFSDATLPPSTQHPLGQTPIAVKDVMYSGTHRMYVMILNFQMINNLNTGGFFCFDLDKEALCEEFGTTTAYPFNAGTNTYLADLYFQMDKSGQINAVCFAQSWLTPSVPRVCVDIETPSISYVPTLLVPTTFTQFQTGTLVLGGLFDASGVSCYDFATQSNCTGYPKTLVPGSQDYGVALAPDGGCFFAMGHGALLYSFDIKGNAPCQAYTPTLLPDYLILTVGTTGTVNVFQNDQHYLPGASFINGNPPGLVSFNANTGDLTFTLTTEKIVYLTYTSYADGFAVTTSSAVVSIVPSSFSNPGNICNFRTPLSTEESDKVSITLPF